MKVKWKNSSYPYSERPFTRDQHTFTRQRLSHLSLSAHIFLLIAKCDLILALGLYGVLINWIDNHFDRDNAPVDSLIKILAFKPE